MRRAFSLVELVVLIGVAGLLGSVALPQVRPTTELLGYRAAMQQVAAELRILRFRAVHEQRTFTVRVDPGTRRLQYVVHEIGPRQRGRVEETVWLPEGLAILEAPSRLTIFPSGSMSPTSVLVEAPRTHRMFRITLTGDGVVYLSERPAT